MKLKDHPKKTPHGSHQPANKSKLLTNKLKAELQKKSRARRDRHAAASSVESAATFHGRNDLQPDLQLVEKPIEALQPSPDRARITTPQQLEGVIKSIKRLGLVLPVLIDGSDTIVSGHVIWEASSKLGFETISCIVIEHLDETELKALSLALNRMAETGGWDLELLREQMIAIESAGIELTTTGFTLPEIDQILIVS